MAFLVPGIAAVRPFKKPKCFYVSFLVFSSRSSRMKRIQTPSVSGKEEETDALAVSLRGSVKHTLCLTTTCLLNY